MREAARKRVQELEYEIGKLTGAYINECLDRSPYKIGQKIEEAGETYFVSGAFEHHGEVYLRYNASRKNGKMSKVRKDGGPLIRIDNL